MSIIGMETKRGAPAAAGRRCRPMPSAHRTGGRHGRETADGEHFVIVNVGANVGNAPMGPDAWAAFTAAVAEVLSRHGRMVGCGTGTSYWDGHAETFATFHAFVGDRRLSPLRVSLRDLARRYGQDAIALVVADDAALLPAASSAA